MTKADVQLREAMSIEAGTSLRSWGATSSGTTAAESSLSFLLGMVLSLAVSRAYFERAECGFLPSVKTKRAKSMWLITGVVYTVSVLLPHRLVVSRMLKKDVLFVWGLSGLTKQTRQTRATSRLLAFHVLRMSTCWGRADETSDFPSIL